LELDKPYNRGEFIAFLNTFLPEDYEPNPSGEDVEVSKGLIQKAVFLGAVHSLDNLRVYEIHHQSESDPRVTITKEICRLMANHGVRKAIAVFISKKSDNYRLSLITIDVNLAGRRTVREYSNPRRYSFYLGPDAKIHTPYDYLIKKGAIKNRDDLVNRFNVELVTKEFFQKYKELYEKISKHLQNDRGFGIFAGKNKVDLDTFAKKLLGQIVFLYFIQRKGWLGATKGSSISSGDKDFVRSLFNKAKKDRKHFFNDYLEYLFYDALNKKPEKPGSFYRDYFECQIPFLNGGLFEPVENYNWKDEVLNIPDSLFSNSSGSGILDIFDLFNFTVYEDDPIDKEVSIDPEMLGKVFENLLPENLRKGKGAYYTPREIVHYMCQESLINYLAEKSEIKAEEIRDYIKRSKVSSDGTTEIPAHIAKKAIVIDNLLAEIKVVDPAVGSGAFLVGMLHETVNFRIGLNAVIKQKRSEYELKKQAIINSLYGVDINPGAVEIAKLRLWLSLVVDFALDDIDPLPNLDFKIMQGNSLIELLSPSLLSKTTDNSRDRLIEQLNKIKADYSLLTDHSEKKEAREKRNILVRAIVNYDNEKEKKKIWGQIMSKKSQTKLFIDPAETMSLADVEDKETKKLSKKHRELDAVQRVSPTEHFEWHINYNEVFEKGGFDVVIANPPYIGEKGHKEIFREVKKSALGNYYLGKMDYFYFFFHLSLNIANNMASIAFITTNYYTTAMGARKLRHDFKERGIIKDLTSFNELKIFESALGQHNMITILRKGQNEGVAAQTSITQKQGMATPEILQQILNRKDAETQYCRIAQKDLYDGKEHYIRLSGNELDKNPLQILLNKVRKQGELLGIICNINNGVFAGVDRLNKEKKDKYKIIGANVGEGIFVLTNKEVSDLKLSRREKALVKPLFKNSDIKRYYTNINNEVNLINLRYTDRPNLDDYPSIKNHLIKFKKLLADRPKTGTLESAFNNGFWYVMSTSRRVDMEGPKIVVPQRSPRNTFGYNELPWYASADVYFITEKDKTMSLKYILALVNSKLYYLWLYYCGKRKGESLELYQIPLSEIPIKKAPENEQKPFVCLVDKILAITKDDDYLGNSIKKDKVHEYEKQIDQMVYKLYGLTQEEVRVVEGEL